MCVVFCVRVFVSICECVRLCYICVSSLYVVWVYMFCACIRVYMCECVQELATE